MEMKRKFKVLIVGSSLKVGGDTLSTIGLAKGLQARGHRIFYMSRGGPLLKELIEGNIRHIEGPANAHDPYGILRGTFHIWKFLRGRDIDVIHIQTASSIPMAYIATRALFRPTPAIIWHNRGVRRITYLLGVRVFNFLVDFVISISDYERDTVIRHGLSPNKVKKVYHGVYLQKPAGGVDVAGVRDEFGLGLETPVIAMVSRLERLKGHRYFLEAAARVSSAVPEARFLIVGGGPRSLEEELTSLTAKLGIEEKVIVAGTRRDMYQIYSIIDIVAHPSEWESLCNVLVEAMFMGKPIVASDCSVMPEIVASGETGILVPPRDSTRLAESILRLLKNKQLAQKMSRAARKRAEELFTIEQQLDEVEKIYSCLCNRKG